MSRSLKFTLFALLLIVVLVFGLVVGRQVFLADTGEPTPAPDLAEMNTYVYDQARPLAEFTLINENGETVTRESLRGRWTFAFVGYTNCPDICPAAMANLRRTEKLLSDELPQPDYLLVSADPEHDTPEQLKAYTGFFGENFHGLTGDLETLRALATSLSAVFVHRQVDGELLVDHSGHFALINPDGELAALIQPPHQPEQLAEAFERIYQWAQANREDARS
ncbi:MULTISPECIES: SCO family protein [unclassified Marinobacter]|uniref:SCO family protein n=1 Tax=unclassified Marinobacter TaxID=83889 RepID=UPI0026E299D1|nr:MULTISPECIES: SCO family protein [unclassified Marinobacter]MDO6441851.1 SCO family protein [Marinobacter sp. 2_MG-2023]MDO6824764.1 SCO family protein [Marinobacter sp. 1_MG-2023]